MPQNTTLALVAAGTNVTSIWGEGRATILKAMLQIEALIDVKVSISSVYATPAFPPGSGPDFSNACFRFESPISAPKLLQVLHQVEAQAHRTRDKRWGPRTLDLDLIAFGDEVSPSLEVWQSWAHLDLEQQMERQPEQLILPHPRVQDRAFVLKPLADIAPDWRHPILDKTVTEMLAQLPAADIAEIRVED